MMSEFPLPEKFFKPYYKVHVASLLAGEKVPEGWSVNVLGGEQRLVCREVWLQAEVVRLSLEHNWLELEEGGSLIKVTDINRVPGGPNWLQPGLYVQVLGELDSKSKQVHCSKIINLLADKKLSRDNCKQLWNLEVTELHKLITKKIKISEY